MRTWQSSITDELQPSIPSIGRIRACCGAQERVNGHGGFAIPWLKLVHIVAVIVWCGTLLYLQLALSAGNALQRAAIAEAHDHTLARLIFVGVATPAALLAIASGTTIFLLHGPLAPWLIAKLTLVGLLVLSHAACGLLVLRSERAQRQGIRCAAMALCVASLVWLAAIAWLVLNKPVL